MASPFDPYYLWLGIPPEEQPPDHYRLLGIGRFESDPEVIEQAAERQLHFLGQMLNTAHRDAALRLQQEIKAARAVLLDPHQKSLYDAQLRDVLGFRGNVPGIRPGDEDSWEISVRPGGERPPRGFTQRLLAPVLFFWNRPTLTAVIATGLIVASALVAVLVPPTPLQMVRETSGQAGQAEEAAAEAPRAPTPGSAPSRPPATERPVGEHPSGLPASAGSSISGPAPLSPGATQSATQPRPGGDSSAADGALPSDEVPLRPGLLGRITVNGEDLGVIVRYFPGEVFKVEQITRLITQYGLQPGNQKLRLAGVVRIEKGSTAPVPVQIRLRGEAGHWQGITVSVDGRAVAVPTDLQENVWNAGLVLSPGDHRLECTVEGQDWPGVFGLEVTPVGPAAGAGQPFGPGASAAASQKTEAVLEVGYTAAILQEMGQLPTLARHNLDEELAPVAAAELSFDAASPSSSTGGQAAAGPSVAQGSGRAPAPSEADVAAARARLREEHRKDYQEASAGPAKVLLARTFLKLGNQESDPLRRYAFYQEARELAIGGGSVDLAIQAGEALGLAFEVDPWALHLEAAHTLARTARTPQAREELPVALEPLIRSAIEEDRYDAAADLLDLCASVASQLRDGFRRDHYLRQRDEVKAIATAFADIRDELETLANDPGNPAANEAVGRFYCFVKQSWQQGLPYLAKAETALLRTVAQAELQSPAHPTAQLQLADDWWAIAEALSGSAQTAVRRHAGFWYLKCEPQTSGETAQRVKSRLAESGRLVNLLALASARRVTLHGSWQIGPKGIISGPDPVGQLIFHLIPPEEYDLVVDIQPVPMPPPARQGGQSQQNPLLEIGRGAFGVGLVQGRRQFLAVLDWNIPNQGAYCFLANYDGRGPDPANPTFQQVSAIRAQRSNTLVYSVRKTSFTVTANGVPVIRYTGDFSPLSPPQGWGSAVGSRILFATRGAVYHISRAELRDVGP